VPGAVGARGPAGPPGADAATPNRQDDPVALVTEFAMMPARIGLAMLGHGVALSRTIADALRHPR
jgi:hypothetical protein